MDKYLLGIVVLIVFSILVIIYVRVASKLKVVEPEKVKDNDYGDFTLLE